MPQLRLARSDSLWVPIRDGDRDLRPFYERHYSARRYRDGRRPRKIMGPGEYVLLVTPAFDALFGWRKSRRYDGQEGVNCTVFRNEGPALSSALILDAEKWAWDRWPAERLFTFVDPKKVRHKRDPGRCFLKAGWRRCGWSKGGLLILEKTPAVASPA